jgi:hypothetical protein
MMIVSDAIIGSITLKASFLIIICTNFPNYDCKMFIVQATVVTFTNYNVNVFIVWATEGVSHG